MDSDSPDCSHSNEGQNICSKKRKIAEVVSKLNKKYPRRYKKDWEKNEQYKAWLSTNYQGEALFYCKFCANHYKGGRTAIQRHMNSKTHEKTANEFVNQQTIFNMKFIDRSANIGKMTKENEIKISAFMGQHDLFFNVSSHLVKMPQHLHLDTQAIQNMSCPRIKCQAIICNVTGKKGKENVIALLETQEFSIMIDESTDISSMKSLAVVARVLVDGNIKAVFVGLFEVAEGYAANMYNILIEFFTSHDIPYKQNMGGFAADGSKPFCLSTMEGHSISFYYEMHLAFCGSLCMCSLWPEQLDSILKQAYTQFSHSFKRQKPFEKFQKLLELEPH